MITLIRNAMASDVEALVALSRETISASYRPFLGDEAVDAYLASSAVERYVADNLDRCLVLLTDERITGYSVYRENTIDLLMIDHTVHGKGLGGQLLARVEATLFPRWREPRLESFEGNQIANGFYRERGWIEAERYFDEEAGVSKVVFRKSR
jgi:GNAT superfamily N-acetyltransferase